jgi:hypothetical protein
LAVIAAGVWIWMARSCRAGKSWARTVSTVLFGLIAIILLWQRASPDYFKGAKGAARS